jgi:DNA polymerase beta
MDNPKIISIKKNKTKRLKPELIIIEEISPKNKTLKSSSFSKGIKRCKKGTKKYKPLGIRCYDKKEIDNYKLTNPKKSRKTKKFIELEIVEGEPIEIIEKRIEPKLIQNKKLSKRRLKIPIELEIMEEKKRYNEEFIDLMEKLSSIMLKQGEPFRARAYQKAQETIMAYQDDIYNTSQLKGKPGIGPTIMDKLDEYVKTGTLRVLEREKTNPINILGDIYGVGPKKAQELVNAGVKTIDELRVRQNDLLNEIQKVGLRYYEQIQERIPRSEIEEYEKLFKENFDKVSNSSQDAKFEIVGSYRRGAETSGDIDVIITGKTGIVYKQFIDELLKTGIILEVLSRGQSKTLVIARLPGLTEGKERIARRVDFLYAPPDEFAFAILYFTGSKIFNTVMRQYGLDKGYTFNEHGIYKLENKKKGEKVTKEFKTEKDIFDFLGLQFKTPIERRDGRAVVSYTDVGEENQSLVESSPTSMKAEDEAIEIIPIKKIQHSKKGNHQPSQK